MDSKNPSMELSFERLSFRYDEAGPLVIEDLGGRVAPGELVTIIGPNGAGKSTLLRLLDGLEQPNAGSISVGGRRLGDFDHLARARTLAFVPQFLDRIPQVHVADFVLGGRYAHHSGWSHGPEDRVAVQSALASCDATGLGPRLLASLSGGQRQRVLIARALAQEAPILLVDEPTNSLDPQHQLAIFELLAGLSHQGHSVLVVTHDLNLASQFSHRIAVMDAGHIVASGTPTEVLTPEVLVPVYGEGLVFGREPDGRGEQRPFVLPWRKPGR